MMEERNGEDHIFQGREALLSRILTTLTQMNRNNVFLIGDVGVGCTALISQLKKQCNFGRFKIFDIEKALLTPNNLLKTLERKPQPEGNEKLIIALDGLDGLLAVDDKIQALVMNWIRQVIIEEDCQLVLACSSSCYQHFFSADKQLTSRSQAIEIKAPNFTAAVAMVNAHLDEICHYYNVTIADNVIPSVVALAHRYVHDAMLPGSALNLIDASVANLKQTGLRTVLELKDVMEIISQWADIPEQHLLISDEEKLRHCALKLNQQIYGQEQALTIIARTLQAGFLKLHSTKPMGMMVFAGPKGVGKISTARALAKLFYGNEHYLLRFNMARYQKPFDLKSLLGDGVGEGLLAKFRQYPAAIYIFEHVDLAHPQVVAELSDCFIRGELEGFDLSHAIVILTTEKEWHQHLAKNTAPMKSPPQKEQLLQLIVDDLPGMKMPNNAIKEMAVEEMQVDASNVSAQVSEIFHEEMTVVPFNYLQLSALESLIGSKLNSLQKKLQDEHQIQLSYSPSMARELLTYLPQSERSIVSVKQLLDEKILSVISNAMLNSENKLHEMSLSLESGGEIKLA